MGAIRLRLWKRKKKAEANANIPGDGLSVPIYLLWHVESEVRLVSQQSLEPYLGS